ncbi:MAG: hypothetical protein JO050_11235 [Acidimicrobiia bacterium]|nr:hypothetical protein [Acidimicrobiia bacterium]
MAQRRTRAGALFQSAALLRWDPHVMVRLLGLEPAAAPALANAAAALSVGANDLADAFLQALSRVSCA